MSMEGVGKGEKRWGVWGSVGESVWWKCVGVWGR